MWLEFQGNESDKIKHLGVKIAVQIDDNHNIL